MAMVAAVVRVGSDLSSARRQLRCGVSDFILFSLCSSLGTLSLGALLSSFFTSHTCLIIMVRDLNELFSLNCLVLCFWRTILVLVYSKIFA